MRKEKVEGVEVIDRELLYQFSERTHITFTVAVLSNIESVLIEYSIKNPDDEASYRFG